MGVEKRPNSDMHCSPTDTRANAKRPVTRQMTTCKVCKETVPYEFEGEDHIKVSCKSCNDRYHGPCVGISTSFFYNMINGSRKGWRCYNCVQDNMDYVQKFDERLDLLTRTVEAQSQQSKNLTASVEAGFQSVSDKFKEVDRRFNVEIEIMKQRLGEYERKLANLNIPLDQTTAINMSSSNDITYIKDLQRKNNLIIKGVPPSPSENLKEIITKVANACGAEINPTDIASVIRLRKKPSTEAPLQHSSSDSSILVKFIDVTLKDDIFSGYIKKISDKKPLSSASGLVVIPASI